MVLTADQQRVKSLLAETVTLLCKNGLHFQSEFSIEGLLGITLDQQDVFLVSIKETIHVPRAQPATQNNVAVEFCNVDPPLVDDLQPIRMQGNERKERRRKKSLGTVDNGRLSGRPSGHWRVEDGIVVQMNSGSSRPSSEGGIMEGRNQGGLSSSLPPGLVQAYSVVVSDDAIEQQESVMETTEVCGSERSEPDETGGMDSLASKDAEKIESVKTERICVKRAVQPQADASFADDDASSSKASYNAGELAIMNFHNSDLAFDSHITELSANEAIVSESRKRLSASDSIHTQCTPATNYKERRNVRTSEQFDGMDVIQIKEESLSGEEELTTTSQTNDYLAYISTRGPMTGQHRVSNSLTAANVGLLQRHSGGMGDAGRSSLTTWSGQAMQSFGSVSQAKTESTTDLVPPPLPLVTWSSSSLALDVFSRSSATDKSSIVQRALSSSHRFGGVANSQPRTLTCAVCAKTFMTRQGLALHRKLHDGVYLYTCVHCGKGCSGTTQLRGHLASHTNVKEFVCSVCGNEYGYKKTLIDHVRRVHAGVHFADV